MSKRIIRRVVTVLFLFLLAVAIALGVIAQPTTITYQSERSTSTPTLFVPRVEKTQAEKAAELLAQGHELLVTEERKLLDKKSSIEAEGARRKAEIEEETAKGVAEIESKLEEIHTVRASF